MKFVSKYTIRPEHRNEAIKRFLEGGGQPPEGVTLLGRYHNPSNRSGYSIVEADDAVAMARWSHEWLLCRTHGLTAYRAASLLQANDERVATSLVRERRRPQNPGRRGR